MTQPPPPGGVPEARGFRRAGTPGDLARASRSAMHVLVRKATAARGSWLQLMTKLICIMRLLKEADVPL